MVGERATKPNTRLTFPSITAHDLSNRARCTQKESARARETSLHFFPQVTLSRASTSEPRFSRTHHRIRSFTGARSKAPLSTDTRLARIPKHSHSTPPTCVLPTLLGRILHCYSLQLPIETTPQRAEGRPAGLTLPHTPIPDPIQPSCRLVSTWMLLLPPSHKPPRAAAATSMRPA